MVFGFDLISDLHLTSSTSFDWTGKPTSLFCVVPGNITDDMIVLKNILKHLSGLYHGVFFIDGTLENEGIMPRDFRNSEIQGICNNYRNVIYLHNNVVVIDGVALVGINGWNGNASDINYIDEFHHKCFKYEDITYLTKTVEKLQLHKDVKKIIIISNCIPAKELFFSQPNPNDDDCYAGQALDEDTEKKVAVWVYGSDNKMVDTVISGVRYVNNTKFDREPYYAKRIEISL